MPRALLSVSDKRGIVPFAASLVRLGWEVVSTGGTAAMLRAEGVAVTPVDQVTGFPEILDGRVKTLHPAVHAGLLARADHAEHMRQLREHGLERFDLVAVNLYPFQATIADPDVTLEDAIENIDIGGPSMLRSAAKNHEFVIPVVDPRDYPRVLELLEQGAVPLAARREFAAKVFTHTADYDNAIAGYLTPASDALPQRVTLAMERRQPLRYGENPDQRAGLYTTEEPRGIGDLTQRQGKELSFNNLLDIDAAMNAAAAWRNRVACAVIKHTTPVRHRPGAQCRRGVHPCPGHRPDLGVRFGGGLQHRHRSRRGRGDGRPLRRGGRRSGLPRRRPRGLQRQEEPSGGRAAGAHRSRATSTGSGSGAGS